MSVRRLGFVLLLAVAGALRAQTAAPVATTPASAEKLFVVHFTTGAAWDAAKPPPQQKFFAEHSANLARLRREGRLLLGARYGDKGMIVLRADDEAAVHTQLASDPSIAAGTFAAQVDAFRPFMHGSTNYPTTPEAIALRAYYDALNRHDAAATAAFCAENLQWLSVDGDKVGTDASSRAQLLEWLTGNFKSRPTVRAEVVTLDQAGPFLTVRERASWDDNAGQRVSQQAMAFYEIRDARIQRVWYFPSVKDPPPPAR